MAMLKAATNNSLCVYTHKTNHCESVGSPCVQYNIINHRNCFNDFNLFYRSCLMADFHSIFRDDKFLFISISQGNWLSIVRYVKSFIFGATLKL